MHEKLDAPDPTSGWVCSGLNSPGWELLGEGADPWPVTGAGKVDGFSACGAEGGELSRC